MKKQDLEKLWGEKIPTLKKTLEEKKAKRLKATMQLKTGQLKNVKAVWKLKKEIAQIQTLIREKELKITNN